MGVLSSTEMGDRADGRKTSTRWRVPPLAPVRNARERAIVVEFMRRLWAIIDSPTGDELIRRLRLAKKLPPQEQQRLAVAAQLRLTTQGPASAERFDVARWMLDHALVRGAALPGLDKADLFFVFADLVGADEDIADVMSRGREHRGPVTRTPERRLDQRKVMTRRSRLNKRRAAHGYR